MTDLTTFTIGPPEPVEDSRMLPVVTEGDESGFVTGADLGEDHPDNDVELPAEVAATLESPEASDDAGNNADLPSDDELDSAVADVDAEAVDQEGFGGEDLGFVGLDLDGGQQ